MGIEFDLDPPLKAADENFFVKATVIPNFFSLFFEDLQDKELLIDDNRLCIVSITLL